MASFLDSAGVTRLVTKLKTIFAVKATTLSGYGITNGVSSVSITGTGQAVSAASISGHTLTLTKGASLPTVRHERPTSTSIRSPTSPAPRSSSSTSPPPPIQPGRSSGSISSIPTSRADTASTVDASSRARRPAPSPSVASPPSRGPSRSRPPRSIISRSAPMGAAANIWPRATSSGSASRPRK